MQTRITHDVGRRTALTALALVAALLLVAAAPTTADASSRWTYRSSGRAVETSWIQVDGTAPGTSPFGNVHIGYLDARERSKGSADAYGEIYDFDCEPGQLPDGGGHGHALEFDEEEPGDDGCVHVGARWLEGTNLAFTMDKKFTQATLKGQMVVYGGAHGEEGAIGYPMANIVWNGIGSISTSRFSETYSDGTYSWTYRGSYTSRQAQMDGTLGPMGFDPELSSGSMRTYKVSEKGREG